MVPNDLIYEGITTQSGSPQGISSRVPNDLIYEGITTFQVAYLTAMEDQPRTE